MNRCAQPLSRWMRGTTKKAKELPCACSTFSDAAAPVQPAQTGGAQLWAQNCGHCHNLRSPSSYSDAQWEVVALHMRVRANLTVEEHKQILVFLKSTH